MSRRPEGGESGGSTRAREHLANERTLLAWVRTAIGLMGLGFVVARFGIFLKQVAVMSAADASRESVASAVIGTGLVGAGVLAAALGAARFYRARAQIERGRFEPEAFAEVIVVAVTIVAGIALVVYLAATG